MQNLIANKNIYIFSKKTFFLISTFCSLAAGVGIFQILMVIFDFSGIILHPALYFLGPEYSERFAL
jgi:hypothetical protein